MPDKLQPPPGEQPDPEAERRARIDAELSQWSPAGGYERRYRSGDIERRRVKRVWDRRTGRR